MGVLKWIKRMFSPGTIPDYVRAQLEQDGILYLKEKLAISVTFRNFKAPGKRYGFRKSMSMGAIAISNQRLVAFSAYRMIVHVTFAAPQEFEQPPINLLDIREDKGNSLVIGFESNDFNPEHSGNIEIRFRMKDSRQVLRILDSLKQGV